MPAPRPTDPGLALVFAPNDAGGRFVVDAPRPDEPPAALAPAAAKRIRAAFARGSAAGVVHLAAAELSTDLPPALAFGRDVGKLFLDALVALPDLDAPGGPVVDAPRSALTTLALRAPPLRGAEALTADALAAVWDDLRAYMATSLATFAGPATAWLASLGPAWGVVGKVMFHLAENKKDPAAPFAFLATYAKGVSAAGRVQHAPLSRALQEHAGDKQKLLALLAPVNRAAGDSAFLQAIVDDGGVFHPLAWTAEQAYAFLRDAPLYERAGISVRVPDWWRARRRPVVQATIGKAAAAGLGAEALIDFDWRVVVDGESLTQREVQDLLDGPDGGGLRLLRGAWVEVDAVKLREVLEHWRSIEAAAKTEGLSILDGMRLLAGAPIEAGAATLAPVDVQWSKVEAGAWLDDVLHALREPDDGAVNGARDPIGVLRPYQKDGVAWLTVLARLGLGACLADDMGLGKTLQVLALLLAVGKRADDGAPALVPGPHVVVAPASLLANWRAEAARFASPLRLHVCHPSADGVAPPDLASIDVVLTTYQTVARVDWLRAVEWGLAVVDEAQAIKNPNAQQTRAVKALRARARVALTGTPIENRLADLWSLFDFLNPGLLGSAKAFHEAAKKMAADDERGYAPLRATIGPFLLRRLKTDRRVVDDLPDKTEVKAHCGLTSVQAALYQAAVDELKASLAAADGMKRRGVVLASLVRLKQICDHPALATGADGPWTAAESAKVARLQELVEPIAARQEKLLCFTQFQTATKPLHDVLAGVFGRPGLVLHGQVPVAKRGALVEDFARDDGPPFFVVSLKAGGTGLNLVQAAHVVHFDRWWNPAVEDQATDRAFRIGQKKNVMVHKMVCRGTVEERVDELIEAKRALAGELLGDVGETKLTEMSTEELLRFVSLDLKTAIAE